MKSKEELIQEFIENLDQSYNYKTKNERQNILDALYKIADNSFTPVIEETPPVNIELLAKSPEGVIHITSWRPAYNIFSCQSKSEGNLDWGWKLI